MKIAVLVPCCNEELTIASVVKGFRKELPDANVFVYDNNSTDLTAEVADAAGAIVHFEGRHGKGNVVRSMFREVEADIYVMVDGDDTYPADAVQGLVAPVACGLADMVTGDRLSNGSYQRENKRWLHDLGNRTVRFLINRLFRAKLRDIMTGYRAFSRGFVKSMPVHSEGYEVEVEMTLHALDKRFRIHEVPIVYRDRPAGSESKLHTLRDGIIVLRTVFQIFKDYKPLTFFCITSTVFFAFGLIIGTPVVEEYIRFHLIYKLPSAILAVGVMVLSGISLTCGFILDTIVKQHRDQFELLVVRRTWTSE